MKEVHNRKSLPIENCDMCDYVGIWPNVIKHKKNFHGNKVICGMCDKPFFDKATLNRHIRVKHDFSEVHICPVCNKSYSREGHLKIHLKVHEEIKSELKNKAKHTCQFCLKEYATSYHLKRHKAEVHKLVNDTRMMNNNDDVELNKNVKELINEEQSSNVYECN